MKVGQKVFVKELGKIGVITEVNSVGIPRAVKLNTGEVISTLNFTIELITIINTIVTLVKSLWAKIKGYE